MITAIEMDEMKLQVKELNRLYRDEYEEAKQEGRLDAKSETETEAGTEAGVQPEPARAE